MPNLTAEEATVLRHLSDAWEAFLRLDDRHPDDVGEFRLFVHQLQNLIAFRVARRVDPSAWSDATEGRRPSDPGTSAAEKL